MCLECLKKAEAIQPEILKSIELNREAFIALMNKINKDANGILVQGTVVDADTLLPDEPEEDGEFDTVLPPEVLTNTTALLVSNYITGFLTSQLLGHHGATQIEDLMMGMSVQGEGDGHAFGHVQAMTRH
jgi:hypothetical protein